MIVFRLNSRWENRRFLTAMQQDLRKQLNQLREQEQVWLYSWLHSRDREEVLDSTSDHFNLLASERARWCSLEAAPSSFLPPFLAVRFSEGFASGALKPAAQLAETLVAVLLLPSSASSTLPPGRGMFT